MAKLSRKPGVTGEIWQVFVQNSANTLGGGLTGLTNASSGLTAAFHRDTDVAGNTAIALLSMTIGTYTSGGFGEICSAGMPGWYQFCPPNTSLNTGAKSCGFHLQGASNMAPTPIEVDLDAQVDVMAWVGVLLSNPALAGLPDVNVKNINNTSTGSVTTVNANQGTTQPVNFTGTAGSALVKSDTVDIAGAAVSTTAAQIGTNVVSVNGISASSVTAVAANQGTTQPVNFTGTGVSALAKVDAIDINSVSASSVTTIGANVGTTQPVNFTGTAGSALVKSDAVDVAGAAAATQLVTIVWDSSVSGHTTPGTFGGSLNSASSAGDPWATAIPGAYAPGTAGNIVGNNVDAQVSTRALAATALSTANWTNARAGYLDNLSAGAVCLAGVAPSWYTTPPSAVAVAAAVLTTPLAESYPSLHSAPTLAQAMYMVMQRMTDFGVAGTTITVTKLDGATTAYTLATDSSTNPTTSQRAT